MNSFITKYQEEKYETEIIETINNSKHNGNDEKMNFFLNG